MLDTILKAFDEPDETREFPLGCFQIVHLTGIRIGRATYQPGWKWSVHNAPSAGTPLCRVPHKGVVLSGRAAVAYEDGQTLELTLGEVFQISSVPHDSWVIGDEPYVSLHILPV